MKTVEMFLIEKAEAIDSIAKPGTLNRVLLHALFVYCFALGESAGVEQASRAILGNRK